MDKKLKRIIGIIIALLYFSSLFMECYLVNGEASIGSFGLIALLLGWMNFGSIGLIWLANPLFSISLLLVLFSKKQNVPLVLSLIASILALSFTQIHEIIKDEAGSKGQIEGYLAGYWLWVTSILLLLITTIVDKILIRKTIRNNGST